MDLELADLALITEIPFGAYGREPALLMKTCRVGSRDTGMRGGESIVMPASPYMGFSTLILTDTGVYC